MIKERYSRRPSRPPIAPFALAVLAIVWQAAPTAGQDPGAPRAVGSIPAQAVAAGESTSLDLTAFFIDPDGDAMAFAATVSDDATATVSVSANILTIAGLAPGTAVVNVFASDPGGLSATQRTQVMVTAPNRAPEAFATMPGIAMDAGQWASVSVSSYFRDAEGDALSYSATTSDATVADVSVAGDIVTVTRAGTGTAIINVVARDPGGLSAQQSFEVFGRADQAASARTRPEAEPPETVRPEPVQIQRTRPAAPASSETLLRYQSEKRNEAVSLLLEWFIPIVGHAYAGDASAGLVPAGVTVGGLALLVGGAANCVNLDCQGGAAAAVAGGLVATVGGRIWGMVSAYQTAGKEETGNCDNAWESRTSSARWSSCPTRRRGDTTWAWPCVFDRLRVRGRKRTAGGR